MPRYRKRNRDECSEEVRGVHRGGVVKQRDLTVASPYPPHVRPSHAGGPLHGRASRRPSRGHYEAGYSQCMVDVVLHLTKMEDAFRLTKSIIGQLPVMKMPGLPTLEQNYGRKVFEEPSRKVTEEKNRERYGHRVVQLADTTAPKVNVTDVNTKYVSSRNAGKKADAEATVDKIEKASFLLDTSIFNPRNETNPLNLTKCTDSQCRKMLVSVNDTIPLRSCKTSNKRSNEGNNVVVDVCEPEVQLERLSDYVFSSAGSPRAHSLCSEVWAGSEGDCSGPSRFSTSSEQSCLESTGTRPNDFDPNGNIINVTNVGKNIHNCTENVDVTTISENSMENYGTSAARTKRKTAVECSGIGIESCETVRILRSNIDVPTAAAFAQAIAVIDRFNESKGGPNDINNQLSFTDSYKEDAHGAYMNNGKPCKKFDCIEKLQFRSPVPVDIFAEAVNCTNTPASLPANRSVHVDTPYPYKVPWTKKSQLLRLPQD